MWLPSIQFELQQSNMKCLIEIGISQRDEKGDRARQKKIRERTERERNRRELWMEIRKRTMLKRERERD